MAKKILIIDASGDENLFLGLAEDDILLDEINFKTKFKHSEKLIPGIEKILDKNKTQSAELDAVGVVRGPGSYTALKICLTVANTLAWGLDIPVIGLSQKDFKNKQDLVKKINRKIKGIKLDKFKNIVEPEYNGQAYYE